MVSRIAILFLAAVPPKLMAKDKKDSSSPERAMDERRGEETKAVKTELQKKSTKWGRNGGGTEEAYVFCLEAEGFSPRRKKKTKQHRQRKCSSCNFGHPCGGDNMCQSSLFDLENESAAVGPGAFGECKRRRHRDRQSRQGSVEQYAELALLKCTVTHRVKSHK